MSINDNVSLKPSLLLLKLEKKLFVSQTRLVCIVWNVKPRVVEPSCLAYAILAPLALFFVDLHKASLPQNMR